MKKIFKVLTVFLLVIMLASCSHGSSDDSSYGDGAYQYKSVLTSSSIVSNNVVDSNTNLKITYSVDYSIYFKNDDIKINIDNKVKEFGGSVLNSYVTSSYSRIEYKVPTNKLNDFLDYVDQFDGVGSKSVYSEDITSDYNYTAAKITTLQASIAQLTTLLASASTLADQIAIQAKIDEYNAELLALSNTKAAYDDELEYSRVNIRFTSENENKSFFEEYFDNLLDIFTFIGIALLYIIPVGGFIFLVVIGVIAIVKSIKKKKQKKLNQ